MWRTPVQYTRKLSDHRRHHVDQVRAGRLLYRSATSPKLTFVLRRSGEARDAMQRACSTLLSELRIGSSKAHGTMRPARRARHRRGGTNGSPDLSPSTRWREWLLLEHGWRSAIVEGGIQSIRNSFAIVRRHIVRARC